MAELELLSSRQNPRVKDAAALKDAAARRKTGLFLAEGARLCADAALHGAVIEALFITLSAAETYRTYFETVLPAAKTAYYITDPVSEKLADTAVSQNFFCVCRQKAEAPDLRPDGRYLVADRVQNPDNLGAIARSAEAFGATGMIVSGGADPYSPKALRASMGAVLRFPVIKAADAAEEILRLNSLGLRTFAAVLDARAKDLRTVSVPGGCALVVGNEGEGVSQAAAAACTDLVTIPMAGRAESLNVSAAAAVLMWELFGKQ